MLKHYGTLRLSEALSYGVRVANSGYVVDKTFYDQTAGNQAYFDDIPSSAALYLDPDGSPRDVGTVVKNPDMAKLYRLVGRLGAKEGFYSGPVAEAIVSSQEKYLKRSDAQMKKRVLEELREVVQSMPGDSISGAAV